MRDAIVGASQEPDAAPPATEATVFDLEWLAAHGHPSPAIEFPVVHERAYARLRALAAG